mmetsp:Transcript_97809/g.281029  ORF Transcript_97809/g.281029 Transcript_97809/m.281029 type:complete len:221 (-) Transcript_97809:84-746(-)
MSCTEATSTTLPLIHKERIRRCDVLSTCAALSETWLFRGAGAGTKSAGQSPTVLGISEIQLQPSPRMTPSSSEGRPRSALTGIHRKTKSSALSVWSAAPARLLRYRCQKMMTMEVQIGAASQQSCTSRHSDARSSRWTSLISALRRRARTAVQRLQFAWWAFISPMTPSVRSDRICDRNSSGLRHIWTNSCSKENSSSGVGLSARATTLREPSTYTSNSD